MHCICGCLQDCLLAVVLFGLSQLHRGGGLKQQYGGVPQISGAFLGAHVLRILIFVGSLLGSPSLGKLAYWQLCLSHLTSTRMRSNRTLNPLQTRGEGSECIAAHLRKSSEFLRQLGGAVYRAI